MNELDKEIQKASSRAFQAELRRRYTVGVVPSAVAAVSSILAHCKTEAAAAQTLAELRRNQPNWFLPPVRKKSGPRY